MERRGILDQSKKTGSASKFNYTPKNVKFTDYRDEIDRGATNGSRRGIEANLISKSSVNSPAGGYST